MVEKDEEMKKSSKPQVNTENRDELFTRYEELLLKKEQIIKEGESYRIAYIREFGELTANVFKAKIECIRLKKNIAFCQKALNQGRKINAEAMEKAAELEMKVYNDELRQILMENKEASEATRSDRFDVTLGKKIYRRLAKKLHPDINKMTEKDPYLADLWNSIMIAYHMNDVERLEELEVLVNKAMKDLGEEALDIDYTDLEERIEALEIKIGLILSDKPYSYGEFLADEEKVKVKKAEMEKELKEYEDYALQLEEVLADLMMQGGATIRWETK